ncbi:hypothetical protein BGX23_006058 [Mortierella sp. AD031]|nr:hypothetical protein BGX23_006058 [Mortierella sp. AD031]
MTTEESSNCSPICSSTVSSTYPPCQQYQQLSPTPSPASSVMSESSMSSVDHDSRSDDSDPEDDDDHRSRLQVTFMRPGCIEEHIIKSRTLAAAKVAAAGAPGAGGSTPMEH